MIRLTLYMLLSTFACSLALGDESPKSGTAKIDEKYLDESVSKGKPRRQEQQERLDAKQDFNDKTDMSAYSEEANDKIKKNKVDSSKK